MLVLHIAMSPLAGAPIRLVNALNQYTDFKSRLIVFNTKAYGTRTFPNDLDWQVDKEKCLELISKADIIHFHHFIDFDSTDNAFKINFKDTAKKSCKFIRQFHSNLKFISGDNSDIMNKIVNDKYPKLVIPHCAERVFLNAAVVPNIIPINDEIYLPNYKNNDIPQVFYSASSKSSIWDARWETKGYFEVCDKLKSLKKKYNNFNYNVVTDTPYYECLKIKQNSDIVIGDICTGSYHLTELEALSQGKCVFAYLDNRIQLVLQNLTGCKDLPFINTRIEEFDNVFLEIVKNKDLRKEISEFSRKWIEKYYSDERMIQHFVNVYNKLLSDEKIERENCNEFKKAKQFLYNDLYDMQWLERRKKNINIYRHILRKICKKIKITLVKLCSCFIIKKKNRQAFRKRYLNK